MQSQNVIVDPPGLTQKLLSYFDHASNTMTNVKFFNR